MPIFLAVTDCDCKLVWNMHKVVHRVIPILI
jgi:hypothetical protein